MSLDDRPSEMIKSRCTCSRTSHHHLKREHIGAEPTALTVRQSSMTWHRTVEDVHRPKERLGTNAVDLEDQLRPSDNASQERGERGGTVTSSGVVTA